MIRTVPRVVVGLAAMLTVTHLGLMAGPVVWRLTGESGQSHAQVSGRANAAAPGASVEPARLDVTPILAFQPFGTVSRAPEVAFQVVGETGLGLTLLGVTIAQPAGRSRAIIAGGDIGRSASYSIGSKITEIATLAEVTQNHVVLEVEGRLETLSFSRPGAALADRRGTTTDLRNLIASNTSTMAASAANDPDDIIARYRAAILQNPQSVMDRLGLELTTDGYRISDRASPGVRQAGFRPGDVVTTVNGRKVGDIPSDQRYFDEVAESGRARVELQRDGQSIIMTFPLR